VLCGDLPLPRLKIFFISLSVPRSSQLYKLDVSGGSVSGDTEMASGMGQGLSMAEGVGPEQPAFVSGPTGKMNADFLRNAGIDPEADQYNVSAG
jgi:hypothetical protein